MMSLNHIFNIASSALSAENTRMVSSASNMANANVVTGDQNSVYRAQYPEFETVAQDATAWMDAKVKGGGVKVNDIIESTAEPIKQYEPNHPLADKDGFVYRPNINYVEEMANMISASRSYQMDIDMMGTAKKLMLKTLQLGQ